MIRHIGRGIFFVIEGVDGNGKSTIARLLKEWLVNEHKMNAQITKEPDKNRPYGKKIYEDLDTPDGVHKTDPIGFQAWFACDSKQNVVDNFPRVLSSDRGVIVADRYRHSMVYGATKGKSQFAELMQKNANILGEHFFWPDMTFILDVSTETSMKRLCEKGRKLDGYETKLRLVWVRQNYLDFKEAYPDGCHIISGEQKPEEILEEIKVLAVPLLRKKGFI